MVREILAGIGIDSEAVHNDSRLRADLGLNSTETTQLEIELRERSITSIDLWMHRTIPSANWPICCEIAD